MYTFLKKIEQILIYDGDQLTSFKDVKLVYQN